MRPSVRIALWAHALASWAALGVLWLDAFRQPNRGPIDGQFWLVFGVTEGLAPLWLPLSLLIYRPAPVYNAALTMMAAAYVPVAVLTAVWRWRCERRRLRASRRAAGQCLRCGYDFARRRPSARNAGPSPNPRKTRQLQPSVARGAAAQAPCVMHRRLLGLKSLAIMCVVIGAIAGFLQSEVGPA